MHWTHTQVQVYTDYSIDGKPYRQTMLTRKAAVAGSFYPADRYQLAESVSQLLAECADPEIVNQTLPRALIVPHAGYIYSGVAAAQAYSLLSGLASKINKVVLLGPSHRIAFDGIALPESNYFATPLGKVTVDAEAFQELQHLPFVFCSEQAHLQEHSIEVHLPFLQSILSDFSIIPILVGDASADEVEQVIDCYLGKPGVLVIVSTDLSHFLDYQQAQIIDGQTSQLIKERYFHLKGEQACGCRPLNGLLKLASQQHLTVQQLALCNSGDTAGDKSRVVGYGAYAIY